MDSTNPSAGSESCSGLRGLRIEMLQRTAQVRPGSSKCDLSGPSRYLEIRHQHCDLGRPKNVLVLKRDRKETRSFLRNAIEQCQLGVDSESRKGLDWRGHKR